MCMSVRVYMYKVFKIGGISAYESVSLCLYAHIVYWFRMTCVHRMNRECEMMSNKKQTLIFKMYTHLTWSGAEHSTYEIEHF